MHMVEPPSDGKSLVLLFVGIRSSYLFHANAAIARLVLETHVQHIKMSNISMKYFCMLYN